MSNGRLDFAHYEFPSHEQQPMGLFAHYEVPSEELLGGIPSLIDLASGEAIVEGDDFLMKMRKAQGMYGVHLESQQLEERRDSQYRNWEMQQEALKRLPAEQDVWSFEAASAGSGISGAVQSMGAAVMRAVDPAVSDHMVQSMNADALARSMAYDLDGMGETRKWFAGAIYNTSRSLTMSALAAGAASISGGTLGVAAGSTVASALSTGAMATTFFATTANETYVNSVHELGHEKATKLAIGQGAFEALVMTAFSAAGLGGVEKGITRAFAGGVKGLPNYLFKQGVKGFGKDFMAELTEEELTTVMQTLHDAAIRHKGDPLVGEDGSFTGSPMAEAMKETLFQTLFMVGAAKGTHRGLGFIVDPSRRNAMSMPSDVAEAIVAMDEDMDNKSDRQRVSDRLLGAYMDMAVDGSKLDEDVQYWEKIAAEKKRTDDEKKVAEVVANRLRGNEAVELAGEQSKVLAAMLDEFHEKTGRPIAPVEPIKAPAGSKEIDITVPQFILDVDPNATIVDPLDLVVGATEGDVETVRGLSVVKELNKSARNGRPIRFIQTAQPIDGAYSGGTIFVSIPNLKKHMKGKSLDTESLQRALTGTFAHEFTHELQRKDPKAWDELYDSLVNDKKYGPLMKESREYFDRQFALTEYMADEDGTKRDPYANLRGADKADAREAKYKEETLAHLMNDHFITTGLVSKLAKTNRTSFEMLRDWLRRIRNTLFRDPLYKGMVSAFNSAALDSDLGIEPIVMPKDTKKPVRKNKTKKSVKKKDKKKHVEEREKRRITTAKKTKVDGKSVAGHYEVDTPFGDAFIVKDGSKWVLTLPDGQESATDSLKAAKDAAEVWARKKLVAEASTPPEDTPTERESTPEAQHADQVNDDIDTLIGGLKDGYSDENVTIAKTDITELFEVLREVKQADEGGAYVTAEQVADLDMDGLVSKGMVIQQEDGKYRPTGFGKRVMAWKPEGEHISTGEVEADQNWSTSFVDGLDEDDVERMEWAALSGKVGLFNSPYDGREMDLINEVWRGSESGPISMWMRENKPDQFRAVVESVWPKQYDSMNSYIKTVRKRMLEGTDVDRVVHRAERRQAAGRSVLEAYGPEWNALSRAQSVVPSPLEYLQVEESGGSFSTSLGEMDLPDEAYDPDRSHLFIDKRTRDAMSQVMAYGELKVGKEVVAQIESEAQGQVAFNKDRDGTVKHLIKKGMGGEIFTAVDWVMAREAHAWILQKLDEGGLSAKEIEDNITLKYLLAQYSGEAASEWGRSGAMMRDRVETARERGQRAVDRALTAMPRKVQRRMARQRARMLLGGATKQDAMKKYAKMREEWHEEVMKVEEHLRGLGWDLDHLDKYLGNPAAIEALVYGIKKAKGDVGTWEAILYEIFINNILSGPLTWGANAISNLAVMGYELGPKRITAALLNEVALGTGLPSGEEMGPRIGELPHLYYGMLKGFIRGAVHFGTAIATEQETFEASLGIEGGRTRVERYYDRNIPGIAGRAQRLFGTTTLVAFDVWQKSMNGYAEVMAMAYRQAKYDGKKDAEVGQFINEVLEDRSHPLWHAALERARDMTFQGEPSGPAKAILAARRMHPAIKWLFPFVLTPDNIFRKGINYSPLGLISVGREGYARSIVRGFREGDWSGINEKAAQLLVTVGVVAMMMQDDDEGEPFITGTNPDQPQDWAAENRSRTIPPMSFKVFDHYVSYARIEPFATWLALSKDATKAWKTHKREGVSAVLVTREKLVASAINMTKEKTFMKTVGDLARVLKPGGAAVGGQRIMEGFARGLIPVVGSNLWRQSRRAAREFKPLRSTVKGGDERGPMLKRNFIRSLEVGVYEEFRQYDQYGKPIPEGANPLTGSTTDFWYKLLVPMKAVHVHEGVADKLVRRYNTQNQSDRPVGIKRVEPYFEEPDGETRWLLEQEYSEYQELSGRIFQSLADSEAVDMEKPSRAYVEGLWNGNWAAATRAARDILRKKWDGVPVTEDIGAIRDKVYSNKMKKHLDIIGGASPTLRGQDPDVKKMSMPERKVRLDREKADQLEQKKVSAEALLMQGYGGKNLRGRIPTKTSRGVKVRAMRFMREFEGGYEGDKPPVRKRAFPRRIAQAR